MLPSWFVWFAVLTRLVGGSRYAWGVVKGIARPNPATWFLWGLTSMIAFVAQIQHGFTSQSFVLLALGITPLVVFAIAIVKQDFRRYLNQFTLICFAIAILGIILWRLTSQPAIAIGFSIIADIFATLPTLHKAYKDPSSEYPLPYLVSMASMAITLLTIQQWIFTTYMFPLYMLAINLVLFCFAQFPIRNQVERSRTNLSLSFTRLAKILELRGQTDL